MSGGELGVKAFKFGLDKGYDRIPNSAFLTPKERKERKRRQREQQNQGAGQDPYGQNQPSPGQGYGQPGPGYPPDSHQQDPYSNQRNDQAYSGDQQIQQHPYYSQNDRSEQRSPMQGDGYYQGGSRRAYNPSDYEPRYDGYADGYGRDQYGVNSRDPYARSNSAGRVDRYRPQSYQGGSYDDGYDSYDDDYSRRSSRRDRRSSKSKSRRSRSRSGIRGQLDKRFDKTQDGLTAGALGALAGGLVGHEVGKGPLATVAGVVIGGLGANAFEARQDRQEKPSKDAQAYGGRRSKSIGHKGEYEEEYYRKGRGNRGRDRYDDDDDSYDDDDRSPRRSRNGPDRKERRRQQEEREEQEKHFGWGNILKA